MPAPAHSLITFSGVFGSFTAPVEIWSFGVKTAVVNLGSQAARKAMATQMETAFATHLGGRLPSNVVLTRTRWAEINPVGLVARETDGAYSQGDATLGHICTGSGGSIMPLQTALVVSLNTPRPGPTGKGRFFLPFPAVSLANDFRITATDASTIGAAVKSFLDAINTAVSTGPTQVGKIVVASSKGYLSEVTSMRIGRVPDTLRSRRSALLEAYVSSNLN